MHRILTLPHLARRLLGYVTHPDGTDLQRIPRANANRAFALTVRYFLPLLMEQARIAQVPRNGKD